MALLECNIKDTALIFEGGGMRASYSCAVAVALLENELFFPHVYGVSAGSSNSVNYISRDIKRTHDSFTTLVNDPNFGDASTFLHHEGYFNAHYLYDKAGLDTGAFPFDYRTFSANPAAVTIATFERDTGRTLYRTKEDWHNTAELMNSVRASSTLPIVMPPTQVAGQVCYDGGLGEGNGLLLDQALRDGYEKVFVVRTRPKGYRKPVKPDPLVRAFFWRYPEMQRALDRWGSGYNRVCDRLEEMEERGSALVVYADNVTAENSTTDYQVLEENYRMGSEQAQRELDRWISFLGL